MTRTWRIVLSYTLLLGSIRALECPSYCQCYEDSDINSISCVNTSHRFIPNYFDFEVKLVNMSGNLISRLSGDSFHNQRYRSLEILDLSRNAITTIENRAFSLLKSLLEIDLSRNQLRSINRKMFTSNRFLNSVILSGNPITEIKHHAFPLSIFLQRLDFQGCRIRKIDDRALLSSPILKYLNLKDNDLRSLSLNVLHNSSQLVQLLLDGNPWRCNKDLWLLLKWIRDHEVGKDSLMCVYDETDDAILWDTMTVDNIDKFESSDVFGVHRGRSPRSQSGISSARSKLADYPDSGERENESEFGNLEDDIINKKTPNRPPLSAETRKELVRKYERKKGQAVSPFSQQELHVTELDKIVDPSEAAEPEPFSHQEFDRKVDPSEAAEPEIVDMNVLLSLICIEFALLVVLLYILYKLWKWNKQPYEQGANITWNNLDKNVKPYHDISPPGYKRYSLSDDNFSLNDNNKEESGKHNDAESGYLSYHRHNSTEGAEAETNINKNEFPHYKRYPALDTSPHLPNLNPDNSRSSAKQDIDTSMVVPCSLEKLSPEQQKLLNDVRRRKTDLLLEIQQLKDELSEVVAEMENMESADDSKNQTRAKQMSIGRKKFNMDPKKGIEYLAEHGLLQHTQEDVAAFLYKGEGLNKTAIGDYLGERNEFNEKVLKAFVDLHDFTDLILVQALRQFLWSFRLPGEAQKIDRMMECFAQRYCQLNPNIFTNTDTCYVLSFAIIMLNTSLHNPSVKDKPSVEQFISMNRGINDGGDLPRELLVSLYESIKTEPFKIPEDDGNDLMHTFFNPDKEGWLWKQGGRYKSWKRRWFILNDNCLYYFEYTTDKEPRGIIPLENIQVREASDRNKPHCFELYATASEFIKACKTDSEGKVVEGKHTVYRMSAATKEEKEEWIKCIRQSISHNPFYDMLAARKKKAQKNSHHHFKS